GEDGRPAGPVPEGDPRPRGGWKIRGGHRPEPVCHRRLEDPDGAGHRQGQAGEAQGLTPLCRQQKGGRETKVSRPPFFSIIPPHLVSPPSASAGTTGPVLPR